MKKILFIMIAAPALVFAGCSSDDSSESSENQNQPQAETSQQESEAEKEQNQDKNTDENQKENSDDESGTKDESSEEEDSASNYLDIYTTTSFSMKVGESVTLKPSWSDGDNCYYEVTSNDFGAIEISDMILTAKTVGEATVKMISNENQSKAGYCTITVTSDDFSGNGVEYLLLGTWKNGESTITFYPGKTGSMKVYLNSKVVQDASFNWSASGGKTKLLTISNSESDYINKQYTITSVSDKTLKLSGHLAFGMPQETTWSKK